jgi:predicted nucleic acid-binding protein
MILDTNAFSALAEGDPEIDRLARYEFPSITAITLGEYRFGVAGSIRRAKYEDWLDGILGTIRVFGISKETADYYSEIRHDLKRIGRPIPANDLWIAAIVRERNETLVTRDRHFDVVPNLTVMSW